MGGARANGIALSAPLPMVVRSTEGSDDGGHSLEWEGRLWGGVSGVVGWWGWWGGGGGLGGGGGRMVMVVLRAEVEAGRLKRRVGRESVGKGLRGRVWRCCEGRVAGDVAVGL